MKSKHSVRLMGHATSLSLEPEFWKALGRIAEEQNISVTELIRRIDCERTGNLSSALRVYVLNTLWQQVLNIRNNAKSSQKIIQHK